jgi:chromosome segregation ATPase
MKRDEVMSTVDTLCRNFESMALRLRELVIKNQKIEKQVEDIENREITDQKEHDKLMDRYNSILKEHDLEKKKSKEIEVMAKQNTERDKEVLQEIEKIRKTVKCMEEEGAKRQSVVMSKKQKQNEEQMSYQALLESKENLLNENDKLKKEIEDLETLIQQKTGHIHSQVFDNSRDTRSLMSGKEDLRKRHQETIEIDKKVKKAEENLLREAKKLEGKQTRLQTLQQVNKTLHKKVGEKKQLESRYNELTEQSLNLQFLISEVMRDIAKRYDIKDGEVGEPNPMEFCRGADEVLNSQMKYINELNSFIRQKNIEMTKNKYADIV